MKKNLNFYTQWQYNLVEGQRNGQACFNAAHLIFGEPAVAAVRGTLYDPFHDDNAIPLFLAWLSNVEKVL